jgi:cytochrome bd-type quinol oxidase subunit 1
VPAGTGIFTLLGFSGLYLLIGLLYVVLMLRLVAQGPNDGAFTRHAAEPSTVS